MIVIVSFAIRFTHRGQEKPSKHHVLVQLWARVCSMSMRCSVNVTHNLAFLLHCKDPVTRVKIAFNFKIPLNDIVIETSLWIQVNEFIACIWLIGIHYKCKSIKMAWWSQLWWDMPVIPVLQTLRKEEKFETSMVSIAKPYLNTKIRNSQNGSAQLVSPLSPKPDNLSLVLEKTGRLLQVVLWPPQVWRVYVCEVTYMQSEKNVIKMCNHRALYVVNGPTLQCSQSEHELFEDEFIHKRLRKFSHVNRNNPVPNG